jgi:hypothetical protein
LIDMRPLIAAVLLLSASGSQAAPRPGPRCPDSSRPAFSGHPFLPFLCAGGPLSGKPGSGEALMTAEIRPVKDKLRDSIEPLVGRWEGWAVYGMQRFDVVVSVEKDGRAAKIKFGAMDIATQFKNKIEAELRPSFWSAGKFHFTAVEADLPGSRREGDAWLGAAPPPVVQGLDRSLVVVYRGLAALHEARFMLDGPDKLLFSYAYRQEGAAPVQIGGNLKRSQRDPF